MTLQHGGLRRTLGGGLQTGCTLGLEVAVRTGKYGVGPFIQLFHRIKESQNHRILGVGRDSVDPLVQPPC